MGKTIDVNKFKSKTKIKNDQKLKTNAIYVSIPFKYLKRSTEEKLKKMASEQYFNRLSSSHDYSKNIKDKSLQILKREYDEKIAERIKKMRSIQEEITKTETKIKGTHKNETMSSIKPNPRTGYDKAPNIVSKNQNDQSRVIKNQDATKDKLPIVISPEGDRYTNRKRVDIHSIGNDGTYFKRPEESTFTVVRDIGTNTYSFDARKYVMLEYIESNNLTFEMLIEIMKKKNTADQGTNTDEQVEIYNAQENDRVSNISDESNSSDALEISDINNNDNMNSTQTNNDEEVLNDNKNEENTIIDDNVIRACVSQSDQNKLILNTFCNRLANMANNARWKGSIPDQFVATNNTRMASNERHAANVIDNMKLKTMPDDVNKNGKTEHSDTIHKDVSKIGAETIRNLANNKVTQNIKTTEIEENVSKYVINNVVNMQTARLAPKDDTTNKMSTSIGGKVMTTQNVIAANCTKEINAKSFIKSTESVNYSSIEKEPKQTDINRKSPQDMLNKKCVKQFLVNLLDHMSDGTVNKKETNSINKCTQTKNEVVRQTTTEISAGSASQTMTATQMIPLPTNANLTSKSLPDLLPTQQQYSRLNAALQDIQKNHKASEPQSSSPAKASNDNQKTHRDSLEQTIHRHPNMHQPAPVAQNIPKPMGPIDPRYHQHIQYQQMISPEHYYGMQTAPQTVTSEMIAKRVTQDPRLQRRQDQNIQPMRCPNATNPVVGMMNPNQYGVQQRPSLHEVRMRKVSHPTNFNPSWPYYQPEQFHYQVPNTQINYQNAQAAVAHQQANYNNTDRYQQLQQQQAAWTSQLRSYPNSNWSQAVEQNNYTE